MSTLTLERMAEHLEGRADWRVRLLELRARLDELLATAGEGPAHLRVKAYVQLERERRQAVAEIRAAAKEIVDSATAEERYVLAQLGLLDALGACKKVEEVAEGEGERVEC